MEIFFIFHNKRKLSISDDEWWLGGGNSSLHNFIGWWMRGENCGCMNFKSFQKNKTQPAGIFFCPSSIRFRMKINLLTWIIWNETSVKWKKKITTRNSVDFSIKCFFYCLEESLHISVEKSEWKWRNDRKKSSACSEYQFHSLDLFLTLCNLHEWFFEYHFLHSETVNPRQDNRQSYFCTRRNIIRMKKMCPSSLSLLPFQRRGYGLGQMVGG